MKNNNRRTRNRGGSRNQGQDVLHQDLAQLIELQKTQETKFVPEIMDVPRLRFNRDRLFNVELSYSVTVVTNSTTPTLGALAFALSNNPNSANYVAVFDQFRIIQVNVKFMPFATAALTPVSGSGAYLYTAIDYDDANAPANQAALLSYGTLKITPGGQIDERTLAPRTALAAYGGTAFTNYALGPQNMFIDSASPTTQYYGLKYAFSTSPQAENINVVVTMAVQFRNQRSS